jgi:hypothetical protein
MIADAPITTTDVNRIYRELRKEIDEKGPEVVLTEAGFVDPRSVIELIMLAFLATNRSFPEAMEVTTGLVMGMVLGLKLAKGQ